jgi:hypothetical protein
MASLKKSYIIYICFHPSSYENAMPFLKRVVWKWTILLIQVVEKGNFSNWSGEIEISSLWQDGCVFNSEILKKKLYFCFF